jgi:hypothetical protein
MSIYDACMSPTLFAKAEEGPPSDQPGDDLSRNAASGGLCVNWA